MKDLLFKDGNRSLYISGILDPDGDTRIYDNDDMILFYISRRKAINITKHLRAVFDIKDNE